MKPSPLWSEWLKPLGRYATIFAWCQYSNQIRSRLVGAFNSHISSSLDSRPFPWKFIYRNSFGGIFFTPSYSNIQLELQSYYHTSWSYAAGFSSIRVWKRWPDPIFQRLLRDNPASRTFAIPFPNTVVFPDTISVPRFWSIPLHEKRSKLPYPIRKFCVSRIRHCNQV